MLDYDIRQMYEDMEIRLIQSMKRNLQRHLDEEDETGFKYPQWQAMKLKELKRYQRQNKDIVGHDTKGFSSSISKYLKRELREGSYNAIKQNREAMGDKYKANKRLSNSFFKINDKKVNALINSVNNDLKTANRAVLRMTNDQYRKVIFQSQLYVANGVMTPKQAIDAANKEFLRRGLNVIEYKDGKRVNIASYSQMAVRTAGQRATLMGEGAARKKLKQHLIQISAHGTSCELCIPWQGKVLIDDVYSGGSKKDGKYTLLSEAMDQGLFHPNCKHGISTYFGGKDDISDINASFANGKDGHESDAAYQDDMNYINRKIREYQRLEVGSLDETNVKTYRKERMKWQRKKEKIKKTPVYNPLDNIAIQKMQERSNNIFKNMNLLEKTMMADYTTGGYKTINSYLIGKHKPNDVMFMNKEIEVIDNLMSKSTIDSNIIAYRGTKAAHYASYKVGDEFIEDVYYSTSLKQSTAEEFAFKYKGMNDNGEVYDNSMMVEIRVPKDTKGLYIGENGDYRQEYELILSRKLKYKVISKTEHKIILEIIGGSK